MWGLLVGDALGVPYEFHSADELPEAIEMDPPEGFRRAHASVPPATWSDDGALALCLLDSLLVCNQLDAGDLMRRFTNWYEHGYLAVDNQVFDVGIQTSRALQNFRAGISAEQCGPSSERENGNGSLMRVLPLALWHSGSDQELIDDAMRQSRVTHGHLRSQLCCAIYCLWARRTLEGESHAWQSAIDAMPRSSELDLILSFDHPSGSGYVVDCLHSARWALEQGPYEVAVKAAVSLGNDTDTTACVAGGLAGVRDGLDAIPRRWLDRLRGQEEASRLISQL